MAFSKAQIGLCCAAFCIVLLGCGDSGPPRYHLTGKVTLGGRPVPAGVIFFDPDASKGNDGQAAFAHIKDGKYDTKQNGAPVIGGPHNVRIHAFDGKPGNELPMGSMIAPEYSTLTELPKAEGTVDFDIPTNRPVAPQSVIP